MRKAQGEIKINYSTLTTGHEGGEVPAPSPPARQGPTVLLLERGTGRCLSDMEELVKTAWLPLPSGTVSPGARLPCSTARGASPQWKQGLQLNAAYPVPGFSPTQGLPRSNPALVAKRGSHVPCTPTHKPTMNLQNETTLLL